MLRFSANLGFLWPDRPLLDRIDAAAAAGFKAIEMHWPYDTPAERVRDKCRERGLAVLGINTARGDVAAGENGLGALAGREAEFQRAVDQSLAYCRTVEGVAVHCMAGVVPAERREGARAVFLRNLREASAKAAADGLSLLLEPLNPFDAPGYFYATADEGAAIVAEAGCANIKLMFDCYHVGRTGGDVIATLERLLPVIGHVQIAAVPSRAEPDQGTLDYRAVFAALERLGYGGWTGAEYKPAADTDAGLVWTRSLGVDLAVTQ
jgi:hydroxypyruvate isomerase